MNRRNFIKLGVVGTGATLAGIEPSQSEPPPAPTSTKSSAVVAMPIGVAPLAQQETWIAIFDDMRDARRGECAVHLHLHPRTASRRHRARRFGPDDFHGGNYARPHMEFYKDTPLTLADMTAPEFGGVDVLERVIPVAKKHGIRRVSIYSRRQSHCPLPCDGLGKALRGGPSWPAHDRASGRAVLQQSRLPEFHAGAGRGLCALVTTSAASCGVRSARADCLTRSAFRKAAALTPADDVFLRILPEERARPRH